MLEVLQAQFTSGRIRCGTSSERSTHAGLVYLSKFGAWLLDTLRTAVGIVAGVVRSDVKIVPVSNAALNRVRAYLTWAVLPDYADPLFQI